MNKPTPTHRAPSAIRLLSLGAFALALACGSSNPNNDAGPLLAQDYFNLNPGNGKLCFAYSSNDAGTPSRGLLIETLMSPPGEVSVTSARHGSTDQIDYLTFDGGLVLLNERQLFDGGIVSWSFATPLLYLQAPLVMNQTNLSSSSTYTGSSSGFETFTVSQLDTALWTGFGADAGGSTSFYLQFSAQDQDAGSPLTQNRRMLPSVGFVQLYATDDTGTYVNFSLVKIYTLDGGICGQ
jgi:hypothetical protein